MTLELNQIKAQNVRKFIAHGSLLLVVSKHMLSTSKYRTELGLL